MSSGSPGGTAESACTRASGSHSCWRISSWSACSRGSHAEAGSSSGTSTRAGRVLMNRPTMDSTPGSSGERPETTTPNVTSRSRA